MSHLGDRKIQRFSKSENQLINYIRCEIFEKICEKIFNKIFFHVKIENYEKIVRPQIMRKTLLRHVKSFLNVLYACNTNL